MNNCINGNCSRCGDCCTPFLPMSKNEVKKIRDYLKRNRDILNRAYNNSPVKDGNLYIRCCFYDPDKKECMIYPVRPTICRLYKCNQPDVVIDANKKAFANSYYNSTEIETIADFRWIFFRDPTLILAGIKYHTGKNPVEVLEKIGRSDIICSLKENQK